MERSDIKTIGYDSISIRVNTKHKLILLKSRLSMLNYNDLILELIQFYEEKHENEI